jgi:4-amino-4-deoxy-L-arabinose transferase-like glycosyltransferase
MKYIQKYRPLIFTAGILLFFFLATRLYNLTLLPIFTDEAIYIRWSQIGGNDAAWRFISLTDGKQPLYTWFAMVLLRLFSDPLVAGRMVSVVSGVFTMLGLSFLSYELFRSKRITLLTVCLYILSPFALMYDRLALYDSLSTALAVWACFLGVKLVRNLKLDIAFILGCILGFGMLNKSTGFLSLYLLPVSLLLFDWKSGQKVRRLFRWAYLVVIAAIISQVMYSVLRLSPYFHIISQKDSVFVHPVTEFMITWRYFLGNMRGLLDWFITYMTVPVIGSMCIAFFVRKKQFMQMLFIALWCFAPLLALGYFGKVLYPRYILFMVIPLLMLTAITIDWLMIRLKGQVRLYVLVGFILFFPLRSSYFILTNPVRAPIPFADRGQLLDDWPAGGGVQEIRTYIEQQAKSEPVAVYTEGTFGLLPYAFEIYMSDNKQIKIQGFWPLTEEFRTDIASSAATQKTYVVLNQSLVTPAAWPMEEVLSIQKGSNSSRKIRLYKVNEP